MRIGIDARELCGHATGVGRYLSGLLREWSRSPRARAHEFVLYAPETPPLALDTRQFAMRTVRGAGGTWWEQVQAPRAAAGDRLDAWFAPAYTAPLAIDVPVTLVVHDVSFFAHPEWFRVREGVRRRWLTRHSVARAAAIITVSQFSKRELMEWLDVPADKITVVRSGIESDRWTSDAGSPSGAAQASQPRVLFVGSLFTRRHVGDLIRAFAPIARARADACLDIVGDNRTYPVEDIRATIRAEQIEAQVAWHHYVSDDRLRALYAAARAFAFLSEYEGMGFTPLEALSAGVPPVLLDTPIAREICGDAALYVTLADRPGTTRALQQALFDADVRARVLAAAPAVLARHDWSRAADETLSVIERCCR
ncbi:MAG TPA: glycosyltransferase family 1 protein [Vicinamibacterales bacterium]|nr:glycosyltransferase family 1 protein [Vicinamibacterales bacterium]